MDMKKNILTAIYIIIGLFLLTALFLGFMKKDEDILNQKNSVSVYFAKNYNDNDYKVAVLRRKLSKEASKVDVAIAELLKGPAKEEKAIGYFTEIPEKTALIKIEETPERVTINLTKDFGIGGGSSSIILRMEQLVYTVLDSAGEKPVYLEIEGEQVKVLGGEGIIIPQPLSRNLNRGQEL